MIHLRVDRVARVHVHYDERDTDYVVYGDVTGCKDALHTALTHDYHVRIHLLHTNRLAFRWSARLGLSDVDRNVFLVAALLHDIGKARVPLHIVQKPSSLTPEEWVQMREHVEFGRQAAIEADMPRIADIINQHHERLDGSGYPNGIRGSKIDELARMLSVIDAFSAMVDDRPYRSGMSEREALLRLEENAGTQFDPEFVESFVELRRERALTLPDTLRNLAGELDHL